MQRECPYLVKDSGSYSHIDVSKLFDILSWCHHHVRDLCNKSGALLKLFSYGYFLVFWVYFSSMLQAYCLDDILECSRGPRNLDLDLPLMPFGLNMVFYWYVSFRTYWHHRWWHIQGMWEVWTARGGICKKARRWWVLSFSVCETK